MTNQKWDFEKWWSERQAERRQEEKDRLSATCPVCGGGDLLDTLNQAIYDWSDGLPSAVTICCQVCEAEIKFSLEWETIINKATIEEVEANDRRE